MSVRELYRELSPEAMEAIRARWRILRRESYQKQRARQLAARAAAEAQEAVQGAQVPTELAAATQGPSQADLRLHPGWPSNAKQPK